MSVRSQLVYRADQHGLSWCYWDTEALGVLWDQVICQLYLLLLCCEAVTVQYSAILKTTAHPGFPCSWCRGGPLPALPPGRGGHHPLLPVHPRHGGAHHGMDRQGRGGEEQPGLSPLPPLHPQLQHHHQPGGGVVDASRESKG